MSIPKSVPFDDRDLVTIVGNRGFDDALLFVSDEVGWRALSLSSLRCAAPKRSTTLHINLQQLARRRLALRGTSAVNG